MPLADALRKTDWEIHHQRGGAAVTVKEWVELISRQGGVCNSYMRKLAAVTNKSEMFRVLCDVNGGEWLFNLHAKGVQLPIESFMKEFKNYVNGNKTVEYPYGYTSKFYCRHDFNWAIVADTTIVYLLECSNRDVKCPRNSYPTLVLSDKSSANILLEDGARLKLEVYGDAKYEITGDKSRVRITKH